MKRIAVTNAFSLNMLNNPKYFLGIVKISCSEARKLLNENKYCWYIGHADTSNIVSKMLNVNEQANRATIKMEDYDIILVAQYKGPRLPEGTTELPENATIEFYKIFDITDSTSLPYE